MKLCPLFSYFCSKPIDRWYKLEPPHRGGSHGYTTYMVLSRNIENDVLPLKENFSCLNTAYKTRIKKIYILLCKFYIYGIFSSLNSFVIKRFIAEVVLAREGRIDKSVQSVTVFASRGEPRDAKQ